MNINDLKEKLEKNTCHIHNQTPIATILEDGHLNFKTCCILFEQQLNLLAEVQNEKK